MNLNLDDLMAYTEWQRQKWRQWFRQQAGQALEVGIGEHGDGRLNTIRDLVRHIFSAEKRHVQRLRDQPLTDPTAIPARTLDELFEFGRQSRNDLKALLEIFPPEQWDVAKKLDIMNTDLTITPRKLVVHILLHEIRHWAQVATLLRVNGFGDDSFHDFLDSPVMGGNWNMKSEE